MDQKTFDALLANAFKNAAVADSFLDNIKVTDYADPNVPSRKLTLRQWIGYSEGRAQIDNLQDDLVTLSDELAGLTKLIETHVSGIIEGKNK
jgi:hypothetical protein